MAEQERFQLRAAQQKTAAGDKAGDSESAAPQLSALDCASRAPVPYSLEGVEPRDYSINRSLPLWLYDSSHYSHP